jgi:uncharacterized surface protein with fasciclin (FAS1) repeats
MTADPRLSPSASPVAAAEPKEEPKPLPIKKKKVLDVAKDVTASRVGFRFSTFLKLIGEAGLTDTLEGDGPFTLFVPIDAAFKKLSPKDLEALGKDQERLAAVLRYHVVAGKLLAADILEMKTAKTLEGTEVAIGETKNGMLAFDKATVVWSNIPADNGVIHVLDTVIMPPVKKAAPANPPISAARK